MVVRYAGEQLFEQANNNININVFGTIIYNVKAYGAKGNNIADDSASIAATILLASTAGGGIVFFPAGTFKTGNQTVPANVTLWFSTGAKLNIGLGATVVVNGPLMAGLQQIFSGSGNALGFTSVPEFFPQWWGAVGDGSTNSTVAFQKSLISTPTGGLLRIPVGNYKLFAELTITKTIHIQGVMAEDLGQTYLDFNLDTQVATAAGIRINNQIHGCILQDFYMNHSGATTTHHGILLDGVAGNYPNFIWYTKLNGIYVRNFSDNFRFNNIAILSVTNCRAIAAKGNGFVQSGTATGLTYYDCYAQDCALDGFKFFQAYYSGCFGSFSDGNTRGYVFEDSYGGYVRDCGSESCRFFAVASKNSFTHVDGLTLIESGTDQSSIFRPTSVYVESGNCNIRNVSEQRLFPGNTRLYTILFENGANGTTQTTGAELLDIRIPYDGSCAIDAQYLTQGLPTKTGWKAKDIGKVVYNQNAAELGTTPNKYIIFGYRRMTTGNGNVLNTDWLQLRALTGN